MRRMALLLLILFPLAAMGGESRFVLCREHLTALENLNSSNPHAILKAYAKIVDLLDTSALDEMVLRKDPFFQPPDIRSDQAAIYDGLEVIAGFTSPDLEADLLREIDLIRVERRHAKSMGETVARKILSLKGKDIIPWPAADFQPSSIIFSPNSQSIVVRGGADAPSVFRWQINEHSWEKIFEYADVVGFDPHGRLIRGLFKWGEEKNNRHEFWLEWEAQKDPLRVLKTPEGWNNGFHRFSEDRKKLLLFRKSQWEVMSDRLTVDVIETSTAQVNSHQPMVDGAVELKKEPPEISTDGSLVYIRGIRPDQLPYQSFISAHELGIKLPQVIRTFSHSTAEDCKLLPVGPRELIYTVPDLQGVTVRRWKWRDKAKTTKLRVPTSPPSETLPRIESLHRLKSRLQLFAIVRGAQRGFDFFILDEDNLVVKEGPRPLVMTERASVSRSVLSPNEEMLVIPTDLGLKVIQLEELFE